MCKFALDTTLDAFEQCSREKDICAFIQTQFNKTYGYGVTLAAFPLLPVLRLCFLSPVFTFPHIQRILRWVRSVQKFRCANYQCWPIDYCPLTLGPHFLACPCKIVPRLQSHSLVNICVCLFVCLFVCSLVFLLSSMCLLCSVAGKSLWSAVVGRSYGSSVCLLSIDTRFFPRSLNCSDFCLLIIFYWHVCFSFLTGQPRSKAIHSIPNGWFDSSYLEKWCCISVYI